MESDTKFSEVRHVPGLRTELNLAAALPFEKVLSAEAVATAIAEQDIEYRERFFLPVSRSGRFYPKSSTMINPAKPPSRASLPTAASKALPFLQPIPPLIAKPEGGYRKLSFPA